MKFSLVVGQGPHKGRLIPVSVPQFLVGRDSKCHLRPASQTISKRHCELLVRDEQCFVRDLNSTNGTFVNDQQVSGEQQLNDGDVLKVGPLDFGIRIEVQAEKPTEVQRETQAPEAGTEAVPTAEVAEKPEVLDEDAVGSMLLELSNAEQADEQDSSALEGSTIMDMIKSPSDDTQQAKPAPYRPPSKQPGSAANTSSAAKAILEKYRRRPRS